VVFVVGRFCLESSFGCGDVSVSSLGERKLGGGLIMEGGGSGNLRFVSWLVGFFARLQYFFN
jgi:hypothetical protein